MVDAERSKGERIDEVFLKYNVLRDRCDTFFERTRRVYKSDIQCGQGCCSCCTLRSVTFLEAAVIEEYLVDCDVDYRPGNEHFCIFLADGLCTIYPVRPIICRTHGLILYNPEEDDLRRSCMLNFTDTDLSHFDKNHALNTLKVTENLTRLNLLYCMLSEETGLEEGRISLTDLAGKVASKNRSGC